MSEARSSAPMLKLMALWKAFASTEKALCRLARLAPIWSATWAMTCRMDAWSCAETAALTCSANLEKKSCR